MFGRFTDRRLSGSDYKVRSSQTPVREKPDTRLEEFPPPVLFLSLAGNVSLSQMGVRTDAFARGALCWVLS